MKDFQNESSFKLKVSHFAIFDRHTFSDDSDKMAWPKSTKLSMFIHFPMQYDFELLKLNVHLLQLWTKLNLWGVFASLISTLCTVQMFCLIAVHFIPILGHFLLPIQRTTISYPLEVHFNLRFM